MSASEIKSSSGVYNSDNYYGELKVGQSFGHIEKFKAALDKKYRLDIFNAPKGSMTESVHGAGIWYDKNNKAVAKQNGSQSIIDLTNNTTYSVYEDTFYAGDNNQYTYKRKTYGKEGYYNQIETATYIARDLNSNGVVDKDEIQFKNR